MCFALDSSGTDIYIYIVVYIYIHIIYIYMCTESRRVLEVGVCWSLLVVWDQSYPEVTDQATLHC